MNSGIATVSNDVGSVAVDQRANLTEDQTITTYEPVLFAVQDASGMAIAPPLYIGTPLRLYFPLADTRKYTSLLLLSCDALNGPDAPQPLRVRLVDDGCPTADGISVMKGGVVYDNIMPSAIVYFSIFRFSNSPVISFECNVKVCEPNDAACTPPQCNAQTGGVSRRRRSAISGGASAEIVLKETLTVLDPSDRIVVPVVPSNDLPKETVETVDQENQVHSEKCFQSEGIVVIIVILVVTVVLLLFVTMCLSVRFIKSKSQVKVIEAPTPMTAERMIRIPRLNF
ncbi:EGF-like domain-containing protein 2 [Patella vulgata]|uniref:EGF-like domain-containing protein 2 n=1 Tax=Patella vulgata TaxID=6465 RepID=UPI0024A8503D|nr:EGF-like domain-containing protein 2 [Patella vulgata]